jgi:hypothetical protein
MAYDAASGVAKVVLFGGIQLVADAETNLFGGTWSFDGTTWTLLSPSTSPSARDGQLVAYDPAITKIVMFGGIPGGTPNDVNDTWTFDGTTWAQLSALNPPSVRQDSGFAWDPALSVMILYGGYSNGTGTYLGDEWAFDGTNWEQGAAYVNGGPRQFADLAQDPANGQLMLFAGATRPWTTQTPRSSTISEWVSAAAMGSTPRPSMTSPRSASIWRVATCLSTSPTSRCLRRATALASRTPTTPGSCDAFVGA